MKYLISEIDDDACCEIPRYICNTRADAEEFILALTEEAVYHQALYDGIDNFFTYTYAFRRSRHPEVKCRTHYGTALWFMSGRFIIEELGEY